MSNKRKTFVSPTVVTVGKKDYQIVTVSKPQPWGSASQDVDGGLDTFRGERLAVLKPLSW